MRDSPARRAAGHRSDRAWRAAVRRPPFTADHGARVARGGAAPAAIIVPGRSGGAALVLQRRAPTKQTGPGAWDVSAAGHFRPDEGLAGGLREIAEELGLTVAPSELVALEPHREILRYPTGLRDREYQDVYLVHR